MYNYDTEIWELPKGYLIFVVLFLLDKCNEEQKKKLLDKWIITNLYEEVVDDEIK
jgi:hypothetical protein